MRTLEARGLTEKTLVVFTSDNGPWWQGSAAPLRGRKNNLTEGGFRVPLVAQWPGVLPAGVVSNELGINFDLFVTCLEIAGVPLPDDRIIDGGIDGLGKGTVETGRIMSRLHLGMVQYRLLVIFVVLVLVALYFFF